MSTIEEMILQGGRPREDSPVRSQSPSSARSDDEPHASSDQSRGDKALLPSSHNGPQTGVKGVRADASQFGRDQQARRAEHVQAVNARMESMALGKHRTWKEDEEERRREAETGQRVGQRDVDDNDENADDDEEEDELRAIRMRRMQTLQSQAASQESRRRRLAGEDLVDDVGHHRASPYGHLREVGHDQFVQAVEGGGDASTYIVVHIYVKYVHACAMLTSALSSLARIYPKTKFVQIRAGTIGFGSGGLKDIDRDEDIDAEALDEEAEDVVPTLLVYKAGDVIANLVRIDLEPRWGDGSERCVKDILQGYNALH